MMVFCAAQIKPMCDAYGYMLWYMVVFAELVADVKTLKLNKKLNVDASNKFGDSRSANVIYNPLLSATT